MSTSQPGSEVILPDQYSGSERALLPRCINPPGEAAVWGIEDAHGGTYAWVGNIAASLETPEARMRAARTAAGLAANLGKMVIYGAPIDRRATHANPAHTIVVSSREGVYGWYIEDPGDGSSHDLVARLQMSLDGLTPSRSYSQEQCSTYMAALAHVLDQLTATTC